MNKFAKLKLEVGYPFKLKNANKLRGCVLGHRVEVKLLKFDVENRYTRINRYHRSVTPYLYGLRYKGVRLINNKNGN